MDHAEQTDEAHDGESKGKHHPLRLLELLWRGDMPVAIELRHDRRQKQTKKRQGLWPRGEGARRKSDDGPRLQPCEEQSCAARSAGHESTAWEEVAEEEEGHLAV